MRKVTCIITETEEDEFLLGRLTLKALGIDVEGQLSALANKEIVDFDPFESETPMSFDPPDKKKNIAQLCELINEAVANGFPAERKRELFEVVMRYDIWRIAIGNDPPSKIEPFVIQFKEGTLPIRCRPRTYAPAEREWMKAFNESLVKLGWVIIVTAVEDWDPATSITEQQHQLVHCVSGTFKGAAQHWSVSKKEAFPIIKAATDLDYLLIRSKGSRLYSDHRNLIFIFAPGDEIKKHVRGKLQRWSLKLNELRYTIEHISGEENVWADMASRWACIELPRETTTVKRW
ncbi:hypothetical protein PF008_g23924 [Phytophthora fragariae]|uniref:Reverse transcriptase RNase H-like domain-containing protein n=1 Tax=Phytophthora fragariae TaxID=53985 RepID=A0A6G0QPJ5_9STRA|nr:hypothetical protein PF008_g23924 [Phytophthora fragariae]